MPSTFELKLSLIGVTQGANLVGTAKEVAVPGSLTSVADAIQTNGSEFDLWGLTAITRAQAIASTFGVHARRGPTSDDLKGRDLDFLFLQFAYVVPFGNDYGYGDDELFMDRDLLKQGGLSVLLSKAIPTVTSSTSIFSDAPIGTKAVLVSVYDTGGGNLNVRWDGATATTTTGDRFYAGYPTRIIPIAHDDLIVAKAIETTASATGWIVYLGVK